MTGSIAPSPDSRTRDHTAWALIGVITGYVLLSSVAQWFLASGNESLVSYLLMGVLVFEPVMIGIWTALGAGSMLLRLPIAIPCLLLLFVAPGYIPAAYADVERREFTYTVVAGFGVFVAATIVFLIFRRITRFRIQSPDVQTQDSTRMKFSLK